MVWGRLAAQIQGVYAVGRRRDCKQERRRPLYHSLGVLGSLSSFVIGNVPQPLGAPEKSLLLTCVGRFPSSPLNISEIFFPIVILVFADMKGNVEQLAWKGPSAAEVIGN